MAQSLDFESDQFLHLLTEALRAGPASPEWHQAVARLRTDHGTDIDEFKLLVAARQHLESGKEYRSVRAGPEFTRKIMTSLEEEEPAIARRRTKVPTANLIAIISALVMIAVVAIVVWFLIPGKNEPPIAIDGLASTYFSEPALNVSFDSPLDPQWKSFGALKLDVGTGLSPVPALDNSTEPAGGGIYWNQPLDASQPVSIEATLRVNQTPDNLIAQVFVTDQPEFSETRGTGQHELTWSLRKGQATLVLPSGDVAAQSASLRQVPTTIHVRILIDQSNTIVEMGEQIWKGAHGLGSKPRYVGLRFLRVESQKTDTAHRASDKDALVFQSLRVLKAQKQ
jgi:hypothetical protein